MRRSFQWLIAIVVVSLAFVVLPAAALAAEAPVIGSTVAYGVTQSDATLEAWIDPGELPEGVYYQFQVVANTSEYLSELACPENGVQLLKPDGCGGPDSGPTTPGVLPIGYIGKEPESRYVRVDLAAAGMTLKPGTTYHYRVLAVRRVQSEDTLNWEGPPAVGSDQTFTTLTPGTPPAIEGETASNITATDATLEATIDPEGLETTYEFYLEAPSCANDKRVEACEAGGGVPIAKGTIPASSARAVRVDVAATGHSLTPNTIEGYRVVASNSAGTRYGGEKTFVTLQGPPPVIESVSLSHLTATDATLEAKIDTEGQATNYQFYMWSSCAHEACEYMRPIPLPPGRLLPSFVAQSVSLDLNSVGVTLRSGEEYGWGVTATSEGGEHASANGGVFEPPEGVFEPLGSKDSPTSGGGQPPASGNDGQPAGAGTPSLPALQTSSPLGGPAKRGAGKPKPEHGKHHKRKHHGKAAKHQTQVKNPKR